MAIGKIWPKYRYVSERAEGDTGLMTSWFDELFISDRIR